MLTRCGFDNLPPLYRGEIADTVNAISKAPLRAKSSCGNTSIANPSIPSPYLDLNDIYNQMMEEYNSGPSDDLDGDHDIDSYWEDDVSNHILDSPFVRERNRFFSNINETNESGFGGWALV